MKNYESTCFTESNLKESTSNIERQNAQYLKAERQMHLGKNIVLSGFVLSLIGMISYCVASFNPELNEKVGGVLYDNAGWLALPALGTIGIGTLLWLIGSFLHLHGAMKSDPKKSIL